MSNVKKGISLVALIITIVVLIILTGAVMMTMNQGDIMGKAKEAVLKSDMANFKEELRNNILQAQLNGTISSKDDVNETDWSEIKQYIPSATEKYNGSLSIEKGELMFVPQNEDDYNALYSEEVAYAEQIWDSEAKGAMMYGVSSDNKATILSNVVIPYSVQAIATEAFYGCTNLKSVTIPKDVTYISRSAFEGSGITSVIIPSSVNQLDMAAFANCPNLSNVIIEEGDLTYLNGAIFSNCTSLTEIRIPNSITSIIAGAFSGCINLRNVYIDNTDGAVTIEANAFPEGCTPTYLR